MARPDDRPARHRPRPFTLALLVTVSVAVVVGAMAIGSADDGDSATSPDDTIGSSQYLVRRGDTVSSVADVHAMSRRRFLEQTGLSRSDSLEPGTTIEVPPLETEDAEPPAGLDDVPAAPEVETALDEAAAEFGAPPALVEALAWRASKWSVATVPGAETFGLGRLDPDVVEWLNTEVLDEPLDPRVPEASARLLAAYVAELLEVTDGDHAATVAAFRQGLTERLTQHWDLGVVRYVRKVLALVPAFDGRTTPEPPPPPTTTTVAG